MKNAWIIALGVAIAGSTAGLISKFSNEDQVAVAQDQQKQIETKCYELAMNLSASRQYDSQSGAVIEGCRANLLQKSFIKANAEEGNRAARVIGLTNNGNNSSNYFLHLTSNL